MTFLSYLLIKSGSFEHYFHLSMRDGFVLLTMVYYLYVRNVLTRLKSTEFKGSVIKSQWSFSMSRPTAVCRLVCRFIRRA